MAREAREGGRGGRDRDRDRDADDGIIDKLVTINRVAKVVKGGRRFAFAALVVVGDQKGRVGYGAGKAREVPEAIRKATERAKRGMIRVPMKEGRTLHHDIEGPLRRRQGGAAHRGLPAPASSPAARCARCSRRWAWATWWRSRLGSRNPHNMVKATFAALAALRISPRAVAARRGKKVSELFAPPRGHAARPRRRRRRRCLSA